MQISSSYTAEEKAASTGTATVTFLSAMHVLNKKLSLEAKPHQGCPQKPSTGLLVHKSRGTLQDWAVNCFCQTLATDRARNWRITAAQQGLGSCRQRIWHHFLCQRHMGFRVWWFLTHWTKLIPAAASPMTADFHHGWIWTTVFPEMQYRWNAGGRKQSSSCCHRQAEACCSAQLMNALNFRRFT